MWRHCSAVRIMRAARHSITLADWVSMTQWKTCWDSRGRSALHASPRTRSLPCTLLLSEFILSLKAQLPIPLNYKILIWPDSHSEFPKLCKFDQGAVTWVGCTMYCINSVSVNLKLQPSDCDLLHVSHEKHWSLHRRTTEFRNLFCKISLLLERKISHTSSSYESQLHWKFNITFWQWSSSYRVTSVVYWSMIPKECKTWVKNDSSGALDIQPS